MSRIQKIREQLVELGISPKRSLGQNFLVGEHVISKIIGAVRGFGASSLVEVGPGLGALTEELLELDVEGGLQLLELDRVFSEVWRKRGVTVHEGDALKLDWGSLELSQGSVLVSNLPYQIGGHLVVDRCLGPLEIEGMVLMFQKEVAQRLMAGEKSSDYGFLTVVAQSFWTIDIVVDAGPGQFYPAPNVSSRVLRFRRIDPGFVDGKAFMRFVKAGFAQRRKLLVKNLSGEANRMGGSRDMVVQMLQEMGLSDKVRAEELSVEEHQELFRRVLGFSGK